MLLYICVGIIMILYLFGLFLYIGNKKIKMYSIKIEEVSNNINMLFEKEVALFNKIYKILNKNTEEPVLEEIKKLNKDELTMFELDQKLNFFYKDYKDILDSKVEYIFEEKETDAFKQLDKTFIDIKALKDYYNANANLYNNLCKGLKYKFVTIFKHYKKIETFIIEKEVDFEILKD